MVRHASLHRDAGIRPRSVKDLAGSGVIREMSVPYRIPDASRIEQRADEDLAVARAVAAMRPTGAFHPPAMLVRACIVAVALVPRVNFDCRPFQELRTSRKVSVWPRQMTPRRSLVFERMWTRAPSRRTRPSTS